MSVLHVNNITILLTYGLDNDGICSLSRDHHASMLALHQGWPAHSAPGCLESSMFAHNGWHAVDVPYLMLYSWRCYVQLLSCQHARACYNGFKAEALDVGTAGLRSLAKHLCVSASHNLCSVKCTMSACVCTCYCSSVLDVPVTKGLLHSLAPGIMLTVSISICVRTVTDAASAVSHAIGCTARACFVSTSYQLPLINAASVRIVSDKSTGRYVAACTEYIAELFLHQSLLLLTTTTVTTQQYAYWPVATVINSVATTAFRGNIKLSAQDASVIGIISGMSTAIDAPALSVTDVYTSGAAAAQDTQLLT
eukprot:17104-Heterococcus_DN1.PRE.1